MSGYDTWIEAPYQDAYAAQERAEWVELCTCERCGYIAEQPLEDDVCTDCAGAPVVA